METTGIGKRLKKLRLEKDLSLELVAWDMNKKYHVELHKGTLSRWENEKNEPSLYYAKLFSDYYNVSLDYLIGLTEERMPAHLLAYYKGMRKLKDEH